MHYVKDIKLTIQRIKHTALIDCELLAKVYINLTDQKEPTLDFQNPSTTQNYNNLKERVDYFKKIVKPNAKELEAHQKYLKLNLKKNFFN